MCDIKGCFHVGRASSWCAVGRRIFIPKSEREYVCERVDRSRRSFSFLFLLVCFSISPLRLFVDSFGYISRARFFPRDVCSRFLWLAPKRSLLRRSSIYPRASSGKYDFRTIGATKRPSPQPLPRRSSVNCLVNESRRF